MINIPSGMSSENRVYIANDGFIYLTGGRNRVLELYDEASFVSAVNAEYWRSTVRNREELFTKHNIQWRMIFVPEKLSVYGDSIFPHIGTVAMPTPGQRMQTMLPDTPITYPREVLSAARALGNVYSRTDSHWTPFGAFVAFRKLLRDAGILIDPLIYTLLEQYEEEWRGDLWSAETSEVKPDTLIKFRVPNSIRRVYCSPSVGIQEKFSPTGLSGLHIGCHTIYVNDVAKVKKTVVLFGSSFSSFSVEHNLLTFWFSLYFECVHYVWSGNLDLDYILRQNADYVFIEMPERFPTVCPPDDFSVDAMSAAKALLFTEARIKET